MTGELQATGLHNGFLDICTDLGEMARCVPFFFSFREHSPLQLVAAFPALASIGNHLIFDRGICVAFGVSAEAECYFHTLPSSQHDASDFKAPRNN